MQPAPQQTLVILFADIGSSTTLYNRVGDANAHRAVTASLALMTAAIEAHGGTLLRTVGDAVLASFAECDDALRASIRMQQDHMAKDLSLRIGFHIGPVIPDGGDVYGNAVNIAARVASYARTEEIVATGAVVGGLSPSFRKAAAFLDQVAMKGMNESVGLYRLHWQESDAAVTRVASLSNLHAPSSAPIRLWLSIGTLRFVVDADQPTLSIGRSGENDAPVQAKNASRRHSTIEFSNGQFLLTDSSTNGTWIDRGLPNPLFLRRDTVVLEGRGQLGFGELPGEDADATAAFSIVSAELSDKDAG